MSADPLRKPSTSAAWGAPGKGGVLGTGAPVRPGTPSRHRALSQSVWSLFARITTATGWTPPASGWISGGFCVEVVTPTDSPACARAPTVSHVVPCWSQVGDWNCQVGVMVRGKWRQRPRDPRVGGGAALPALPPELRASRAAARVTGTWPGIGIATQLVALLAQVRGGAEKRLPEAGWGVEGRGAARAGSRGQGGCGLRGTWCPVSVYRWASAPPCIRSGWVWEPHHPGHSLSSVAVKSRVQNVPRDHQVWTLDASCPAQGMELPYLCILQVPDTYL